MRNRVRQAFDRVPSLVAFTFDKDLDLAEVEITPCPKGNWGDEIYGAVDLELSDLVEELEDEQASELLRGRTFVRTVH